MMRRASVVIGANYGDEGKGLATDWLASGYGEDAVVVRFNGGAQAGHTVVTPDGRRHVFSHIGSGALTGAATCLSRYFVCHPPLFFRERAELASLGVIPRVTADPACLVTTPYDILLNQAVERRRGTSRHGSCGLGFGETIERSLRPGFSLTAGMLRDRHAVTERLRAIRAEWLPARLHTLGVTEMPEDLAPHLESDGVLYGWADEAAEFAETVTLADVPAALAAARRVIFEGAQGLLLDQDAGTFPYVTRSHTGLRNAAALASEAGLGQLDVVYVTRSYLTRHGAGPLPGELPGAPWPGLRDETNQPNPWQGSLRFAWLDLEQLGRAVAADLATAPAGLDIRHRLMMTCLDQVDERVPVICGGQCLVLPPELLLKLAARSVRASTLSWSEGPCRNDVNAKPVSRSFPMRLAG